MSFIKEIFGFLYVLIYMTNGCFINYCDNGGTCMGSGNIFYCQCPFQYTGDRCQTEKTNCDFFPCLNGGICELDDDGQANCTCPIQFAGAQCQVMVSQCYSAPCQNGGQCVPIPDSYKCECLPFYAGVNCEEQAPPCASEPCMNGGNCTDDGVDYTCHCIPPFRGVNCDRQGMDTFSVSTTSPFDSTPPCLSAPCQNGGNCTDDGIDYTCTCFPPYRGINCERKVKPCDSNPCLNDGECTDSDDFTNYTCECPPNFTGFNCETEVNPCDPNPCMNGGQCIVETNLDNMNSTFTCSCPVPYTGKNCEELSDGAPSERLDHILVAVILAIEVTRRIL